MWSDSVVDLHWNLQRHVCCWQLLYTLCFQWQWRLNTHVDVTHTHTYTPRLCLAFFFCHCVFMISLYFCSLVMMRYVRELRREMNQSGDVLVVAAENTGCKLWLGWEVWKNWFNIVGCFPLKLLSLSGETFKSAKWQLFKYSVGFFLSWPLSSFIFANPRVSGFSDSSM